LEEVLIDEEQLHYKPRKVKNSVPGETPVAPIEMGVLPENDEDILDFISLNFKPFNWITKSGQLAGFTPTGEDERETG
jgi:hypothetical protein